jgi:hypothetical protein
MTKSFEKYNDILLDAFCLHSKSVEIAHKKHEILSELLNHYNITSGKILFMGFSPAITTLNNYDIYISDVSQEVRNYLDSIKKSYNFVDKNNLKSKFFDVVIAVDEFLTFANSDSDQRSLVEQVSGITKNIFVTTLRDYKNQDFKDREFSLPIVIKSSDNKKIYFEHYEYSTTDRNMFYSTSYTISDEDVIIIGPFKRRSMFFKQLAKFSFDAGARNFLVHQNLMHKSIIKKNYEHILTIKF